MKLTGRIADTPLLFWTTVESTTSRGLYQKALKKAAKEKGRVPFRDGQGRFLVAVAPAPPYPKRLRETGSRVTQNG